MPSSLPQSGQRPGLPTPPKQPAFSPFQQCGTNEFHQDQSHEGDSDYDTNNNIYNDIIPDTDSNVNINVSDNIIAGNPEGYASNIEIQQTREIFSDLSVLVPHRFTSKEIADLPESVKQFKDLKIVKLLKIDPNLEGSWLIPSNKEESSDSYGYWDPKTRFPSESSIYPPNYILKPPKRPSDLSIVNKDLKKLLEGPVLDKPNLNHAAFQEPKKPITFKNTLNSKMEFLFKKCLLEGYTAEQYNEIALEMFPMIITELEGQFGNLDNRDLPTLELLHSLICLTGHSISRMSSLHTAGLVTNKLAIRDKILLEFDHPIKTKNILRGSGFLTDNAFGPLPESLRTSIFNKR